VLQVGGYYLISPTPGHAVENYVDTFSSILAKRYFIGGSAQEKGHRPAGFLFKRVPALQHTWGRGAFLVFKVQLFLYPR
jgi:hypothetical protein